MKTEPTEQTQDQLSSAADASNVFDVIIVGGGVTGCAMAAALATEHRSILVLEARTKHKPRFAGELLHPTGTQVLDDLGFLPTLRRHGGVDVDGFAVVKSPGSPVTKLPYSEIAGNRPTGFAMEHRDLVDGMRAWAQKQPGVTFRKSEQVESLIRAADGRVCGVTTKTGTFRAKLVLGCDGRHSKMRALLGLSEQARLLSFSVAMRLPDAAKLLPCPTFGHIFLGAWGPMLIYPIGGPSGEKDARGCFDVSSELSGGPQGAIELLRREYAQHLPASLAAALLDSLAKEPPQIAANEAIRTENAVAHGAAIVGDAAGCAHPLTAAGMTVCFTDASRLGTLLSSITDFGDETAVDAALRQYEIERYRFVRVRELLTDALYEVFRGTEPGTRALREGIFRYWEGNRAARARSMALLSGADSRPSVFLREYLSVIGFSTSAALWGETDRPAKDSSPLRERIDSLWGLGQKSVEKAHLVFSDVRREFLRARNVSAPAS
ncbi:MAG TPA: FAD-dependent oxidoreductase [Pseudomonadota bacterium]|nr:FAD-dependent oxidoreductase [Pseudomonadota bacterium]